jgi:hypothetical protein
MEECVREALDRAFDGQYYVFGDTGMDDGEYNVVATHVDGVEINENLENR